MSFKVFMELNLASTMHWRQEKGGPERIEHPETSPPVRFAHTNHRESGDKTEDPASAPPAAPAKAYTQEQLIAMFRSGRI